MDILTSLRLRIGSFRQAKELHHEIQSNRQEIERANREVQNLKEDNKRLQQQIEQIDIGACCQVDPKRLIWLFGNPRTGSTWLRRIMSELHPTWNEPFVGALFGDFVNDYGGHTRRKEDFILGGSSGTEAIRRFILYSVASRYSDANTIAVKEPNGSQGALIISEALPESGFVFLVRDPRDVVASALDAHSAGGFRAENRRKQGLQPLDPDWLVEDRANNYARNITTSKEAYASHEGPKVQISYEELRRDTLNAVLRMYSALRVWADSDAIKQAVEKHSWENIPDEGKGVGLDRRKATPGGFREDLTQEQIAEVERITAPLMDELGYERVT